MRIFVGNLSSETRPPQLRAMFEVHGPVKSARLAKSKESGELRGYAIVEMEEAQGQAAIVALSGVTAGGRRLRVRASKKQ